MCDIRRILRAVFEKIPKNLIFWVFLGPKNFFWAKIKNRALLPFSPYNDLTLCAKAKKFIHGKYQNSNVYGRTTNNVDFELN